VSNGSVVMAGLGNTGRAWRVCLAPIVGIIVCGCSPVPPPAVPLPAPLPDLSASAGPISPMFSEAFALSLVREYSLAAYRECRLSVTQDRASVSCNHWNARPPRSREDVLSLHHVRHIRRLLSAANLDGDPSTGRDGRAGDGVLETPLGDEQHRANFRARDVGQSELPRRAAQGTAR
jgi:hypothetical protein